MFGLPHLQIGRTGNGGARVNQFSWLEDFGTVFALVAAGFVVTAMRTGSGYITVGKKAAVVDRKNLFD